MMHEEGMELPGGAIASARHRPAGRARPAGPGRRAWRLGALLVALAGASAWSALHCPWYQEYRYARMSIDQLQRERGDRLDNPRLLYHLGRRLNAAGRFAEADPLLRNAVGIEPDVPRLRDEWARALLGSGLTTAAFGQLRQFAGTHPQLPEAHLLLGKFYFTQRSMRRASEECQQAISLDPKRGEAWSLLAGAQADLGELEAGRRAAQRAVALRPGSAGDRLVLASLLDRANDSAGARGAYAAAVRLAPADAPAHREYAGWLLKAGRGEADLRLAEAEARRAVALAPSDATAQLFLGRALLRRGQQAAAVEPLERAAARAPADPAPALALSETCRALGRAADAARWEGDYLKRQRAATAYAQLWEALRIRPDDRDLHARLARLLGERGDVEGCVRHHGMSLRCAPDAPPALIVAANDLTDGGHAAAALPLAQRAVRLSDANPAAHEALGNVYLGLGRGHLAGLEYNKTASWLPQRTPILKERLARYFRERAAHPPPAEQAYREALRRERSQIGPRRATPEVEELAQRAVTLEPDNPNYLWYLLRIRMAMRKNEAAIETARQLLVAAPNDGRAHAMLAVLLLERAKTPTELQEIDQQLEAAASEPLAAATRYYGLGLLALRRNDPRAAVSRLRRAAELDPNADVTYYQLAQAEKLAGDAAAAERAMAAFRRRQEAKRLQAEALGDIAQRPDDPAPYERAIRLFESQGLHAQADAIRVAARRRFGARRSRA
jgi:tetratricopeptide (TPR) repeat protein